MGVRDLTAEQQEEIAACYQRGVPLKLIAADFGVHMSYPTALAKRRGLVLRQIRPKQVVHIRLRPDQWARLTRLSKDTGTTREVIGREAIAAYIGATEQ